MSTDHLIYPARGCRTHTGQWGVHPLRLTMDSSAPARALRGAPSSSPGRARLGAGHQKSGMTGGRYKYLLGSTEVWHLKVRRRNKPPNQDSCSRCFSALLHLVFGSSVMFGWRQVSSGNFKKHSSQSQSGICSKFLKYFQINISHRRKMCISECPKELEVGVKEVFVLVLITASFPAVKR